MTVAQDRARERREGMGLFWVDLAKAIASLATSIATGDRPRRLSDREALFGLAQRFSDLVGHPLAGALLSDQVAILSLFGDKAAKGEKVAMGILTDCLLDNVEEISRLLSADQADFPSERFRDCLFRHAVRQAAYMAALMAGNRGEFERAMKRSEQSRDELASIWLPPRPGVPEKAPAAEKAPG